MLIFHIVLLIFVINSEISFAKDIFPCDVSSQEISYLSDQIKIGDKSVLESLPNCKKSNRNLFIEIVKIDYSVFEYASEFLKNDEIFINDLIIINPNIIRYISDKLLNDRFFISKIAINYPNILEYTTPKLLDNKMFIKKMIALDPKNFVYASERLKNNKEIILLAIKQDGKLIEFVPSKFKADKEIIITALKSNYKAFSFIAESLKNDFDIKKIVNKRNDIFLKNIKSYLKKNYAGLDVGPNGIYGYAIINRAKLFSEKQISHNPYVTKWNKIYKNGIESDDYKLEVLKKDKLNWKEAIADLSLVKKIENIFLNNGIDRNTIDSLDLISFWEVNKDPEIIAFNLYLLRQPSNKNFSKNIFNINSLTAIAWRKQSKNWKIDIIDAIFDKNIEMDMDYKNGHKKYKIWDLYQIDKNGDAPKILFKIEDEDREYFELFSRQLDGQYKKVFKGGGYNTIRN